MGLKSTSHSLTHPSRPPVAKPSSHECMLKIPAYRTRGQIHHLTASSHRLHTQYCSSTVKQCKGDYSVDILSCKGIIYPKTNIMSSFNIISVKPVRCVCDSVIRDVCLTHSVCRLYRSCQVQPLPHINVSIQSARIRHFIFRRR